MKKFRKVITKKEREREKRKEGKDIRENGEGGEIR